MNWYFEVWKKYAVFSGRSRREEYWYFTLFNFLALMILSLVDSMLGTYGMQGNLGLLSGVYSLAVLLPEIAVTIRRLHDIGRSGWWLLIGLVPLLGWIVMIVFMVQDSEPGSNQYGANPKTAW